MTWKSSISPPCDRYMVIGDIAMQVEYILRNQFSERGFDTKLSPLYSQALVGMVALVGQWWLDAGNPKKEKVAAHLVNLAWNGLRGLEVDPALRGPEPNA